MEASFKSTLPDKRQRYAQFLEQFAPLIEGEKNEISVLANTSAALKEAFGFFWVGFYLVHEGELHLGPFQGSVDPPHLLWQLLSRRVGSCLQWFGMLRETPDSYGLQVFGRYASDAS